ncbi:MAG TPA: phosphatase PAP2 family protein [Solirubrobacterales bacterium]|nr:phosphatase PAP2 family protein [Solirubrobacterales bacterium]
MIRAAAGAALAASFLVPLARRRLRIHPVATVAATAAGPLALAVLLPRTRTRDVALFASQMWAFTVIHELPYDRPERLRDRLRITYPIVADRLLGAGELPNVRLQRAFSRPRRVTRLDRVLAVIHWAWFIEPYLALVWILLRNEERFPRAARQMAAAFDLGCLIYFAVPTAPPWWAAENGYMAAREGRAGEEIVAAAAPPRLRRVMVEVGEGTWGRAWPSLYSSLGGNPWAAMPSLHFATSALGAILLSESGPLAGGVGWSYALALGFALVYLGEHYVVDLIVGAAVVAAVRRGEPLARPLAQHVSGMTQRLERIANS